MDQPELRPLASRANKCAFIQDPDPVERLERIAAIEPSSARAESVEADRASPSAGRSPCDRSTLRSDPINADKRTAESAESAPHKASDDRATSAPSDVLKCSKCVNSRIALVKYGSRLGEKRLRCITCNQWFGEVVKGISGEKRGIFVFFF